MGGKGQLFAEGVAQSWEHSVNREYGDGGSQTFNSNAHSGEKSSNLGSTMSTASTVMVAIRHGFLHTL